MIRCTVCLIRPACVGSPRFRLAEHIEVRAERRTTIHSNLITADTFTVTHSDVKKSVWVDSSAVKHCCRALIDPRTALLRFESALAKRESCFGVVP
jgi:hypothetical protein